MPELGVTIGQFYRMRARRLRVCTALPHLVMVSRVVSDP
jgi:hypothetical protein